MLDSAAIDRIVQNVLKQLSPSAAGVRSEVKAAPVKAAVAVTVPVARPVAVETAVSLADMVITGDLLAERVKTAGGRILVSPKAILTPTAKDYIRIHRLEVVRSAGEKKGAATKAAWKLIVVTNASAVDRLYPELGPAWSRELLGCPDDAATLVISELSRGEIDGAVILARQSFRAACRANRHEKVRAAAVRDAAEVRAARGEMRLNTIAIDPSGKTYFELRNMFAAFTAPWPEPKR